MNKISILSVLAVMVLVFSIGAASAFGGNFYRMDPESREETAKSDRMTDINFNNREDRHVARSAMHDEKSVMRELRDDKIKAIEAGNYEDFKKAAQNWPQLSNIQNEDDFE